jgi:Putative addiction module component
MAVAIEALKAELAAMTERERADLAHFLLNSLNDVTVADADLDVEEVWATELARRATDIRRSTAVGRPADQMFAELSEKHSR